MNTEMTLNELIEINILPENVELIIYALSDKIEKEMADLKEAICYGDNNDIAESISRIKEANNVRSVLQCELEDFRKKAVLDARV